MPRRMIEAPPEVQGFMDELLQLRDDGLADHLFSFNSWSYPRGDLFQWVAVLNKLDAILEALCARYELKYVQKKSFLPQDKKVLVAITTFTCFLLDHCANRNLYASANNVNELLNTTDIDVLEQTCRLTLRLAQRAGQHRQGGRTLFHISQERVAKLATSLEYASKERGSSSVPIDKLASGQLVISEEWKTVCYWYFKSADHSQSQVKVESQALRTPAEKRLREPPQTPTPGHPKAKVLPHTPATPAGEQIERVNEGMSLIEITPSSLASQSFEESVQEAIRVSQLPEEHHFDLMLRLRFAKFVHDKEKREQLVTIRILCLASLAYTANEAVLQSRIFTGESNIIHQLANILQPETNTLQSIQVAAIAALDGIAHHRAKFNDVLSALGASVNHGLLMYILKNTIRNLDHDDAQVSGEFVEALIGLLHFLTTNTAGLMLVSAGLIQQLIRVVEIKKNHALRAVVKSLTLLDHMLYSFHQSFTIFCNAKGLEVIVSRIKDEIEYDMDNVDNFLQNRQKPSKVDYAMPHERFSLLKTMLKCLVHMMQSSGTADGLRNLIESSLLESLKRIFQNVNVFGSSIFSVATNIMATFIHNEPTSYPIIHEAKVSEVFLQSVNQKILPSHDAMTTIPNAFGAICLNSTGLDLFNTINPLNSLFKIFLSAPHCEALRDSDAAGLLGTSIDELVRHHPSLKEAVLRNVMMIMREIKEVGSRARNVTTSIAEFQTADGEILLPTNADMDHDETIRIMADEDGLHRPAVTTHIDIICRFLEGLLQNSSHCRELVRLGLIDVMLAYYELPSLPYDFAKSPAALSMSHIFRQATEVDSHTVLHSTFQKIKQALDQLGPLCNRSSTDSIFQLYLDSDAMDVATREEGNTTIGLLCRTHSYCVLLSDLYAIPVFSGNPRSTLPFYNMFITQPDFTSMLESLGQLHRSIVWEDVVFASSVPEAWLKATMPKDDKEPGKEEEEDCSPDVPVTELYTARFRNTKMIRFYLCQMPPCITPFFQGLSKMLVGRRPLEGIQRSTALKVAKIITKIITQHLTWIKPTQAPIAEKFSYWIMVLSIAQMLFLEGNFRPDVEESLANILERTSSALVTTLLVSCESPLNAMIHILGDLWNEALSQTNTGQDLMEHKANAKVYAGMKLILHLFQQFTADKAVLSAPQTLCLVSRDKDKDKPDYFNSHAFLKKLRTIILPAVMPLWNSEQIGRLSTSALKNLIAVLTQTANPEGEKPPARSDTITSGIHSSALGYVGGSVNSFASQDRAAQLMENGVSRQSALSALLRNDNNVDLARDHLRNHLALGQTGSNPATMDADSMHVDSNTTPEPIAIETTDESEAFDALREELRRNSIMRASETLHQHHNIVFDLSAFIMASVKYTKDSSWVSDSAFTLVATMESLKGSEDTESSSQLTGLAHLLAKLTHENDFFALCKADVCGNMETFLPFIEGHGSELATPWIASMILVLDAVVSDADRIEPIKLGPKGELLPNTDEASFTLSNPQRNRLFDAIFAILKSQPSEKNLILSTLQFMLRLTRDRSLALRFVDEGGLLFLFELVKTKIDQVDQGLHVTIIVLLRHIIEDKTTISKIMEHEIKSWFAQPKARNSDLSNFVRHNNALALRDHAVFVETVSELCHFPKFDERNSNQMIALRPVDSEGIKKKNNEDLGNVVDNPSADKSILPYATKNPLENYKVPSVERPDGVIHFILGELYSLRDVLVDEEAQQTPTASRDVEMADTGSRKASDTIEKSDNAPDEQKFKASDHPEYMYRCFLLQCLTEILSSYDKSKLEFINHSRRLQAKESMTPLKPRFSVLNFFFSELISLTKVNTFLGCDASINGKKKFAIANWGKLALVALCSHTGGDQDDAGDGDLLHVRRVVLDAVIKGIRDACTSHDPLEARYSKICSIADFCHRLLTTFPSANTSINISTSPETHKQIAKMMLEKNLVSVLTQALSDVDLQYPNARKVVKVILRPLKALTKIAITLSENSELTRPAEDADEAELEYENSTSESEADNDREETPDLYRNSALGMFGGDIHQEDGQSSYASEGDHEEIYDEMDFDDEGSETGSAVSDEEIELDGVHGDHMDVEVMIDDHTHGALDMASDSENDMPDDDEHDEGSDSDDDSGDDEDDSDVDDDNSDLYDDNHEDAESGWQTASGDEQSLQQEDEEDEMSAIETLMQQAIGDGTGNGIEVINIPDGNLGHGDRESIFDSLEVGDEEGDSESIDDIEEALIDEEELNNGEDDGQWGWLADDRQAGRPRGERQLAERLWDSLRRGPTNGRDEVQIRRSRLTGGSHSESFLQSLSNPLLSDSTGASNTAAGDPPRGENFAEWVDSIEALIGGGAVQLIGDIMQRPGGTNGRPRSSQAIRVEVSGNGGANVIHMDPMFASGRGQQPSRISAREDPITAAQSFSVVNSCRRWHDEAVILFVSGLGEKALLVINYLLQAMLPKALEEDKVRKIKEAEEKEKLRLAREQQEQEEARKILEEREKTEAQQKEAEIRTTGEETLTSERDQGTMEGVEGTVVSTNTQTASTARQTIELRGQIVDLTGLGVDIEFLEALPEDMREEVLTQHIRERRASTQEATRSAELSPEFLEALPAEIRAELIQQEQADRRRRAQTARRSNPFPVPSTQSAQSAQNDQQSEMDPASFLASLDPALRQSVLLEQSDDFLDMLPPEMLAEINDSRLHSVRDLERMIRHSGTSSGILPIASSSLDKAVGKTAPRRDMIQLLDRSGICSLLRLIFLPASSQKNLLHDVLLNISENRANRAEVVNFLLIVLQDGSVDLAAAEKCFTFMSRRSRVGATTTDTPKLQTPKHKTLAFVNTTLPHSIGENAPSLIALQCLQALTFLVSWNDHLPSYFLNEHDIHNQKKINKNKGKGKEAVSKASRYPINTLVSLLDRPTILQEAGVLEQLSQLLASVTRPLLILKKKQDKAEKSETTTGDLTSNREPTGTINPDDAQISGPTFDAGKSSEAKRRSITPPEIPEDNLRLVVNILTANECSSKTFQHALAAMSHFSVIPGAKAVISEQLAKQAQDLGQQVQEELITLLQNITNYEATSVQGVILSKFSRGSSDQAKLLRILKAIDYLFDKRAKDKNVTSKMSSEKETSSSEGTETTLSSGFIDIDAEEYLSHLYDSLNFGPLWEKLSRCLTIIHEKSDMIHVATVLLPLIEALMVICKNTALKDTRRQSASRATTPSIGDSMDVIFFEFTENHKKILNQMVRNNPALMSGSFSLLVQNPKVLEFDNKRNYFTRKLHDRSQNRDQHYPPVQLNIRRDMIFMDSYQSLHFKSGNEIKYAKLNIRFRGEEGVDAGGVQREWYQVLARQMFNPDYALFVPVNADRNTFHPNKTSGINPEHLSFFKFVGRIVGKALYDGRLLDCHFSRPVYRKMLSKNVSLKDMETLDLDYYKSLLWMLENDITDVITETFSVETDDFGEKKTVDLIPDGRDIAVTEDNKQDYIAKVTEYRLLTSVKEQLEAFMQGFNDIIPPELASIFNEKELELLISGLPDIDADDWRNNTDYHNYRSSSPQIQWFWRAVRSFDDEERARLLQFCTGSSRIPIEGFAHLEGMHGVQKFNIHRDYTTGARLPQSHTCFNQLDLPGYDSYEALRTNLLTAISEGNEGFGFA